MPMRARNMVGYRISTRQATAIVAAQVQHDGLVSIRYSHAHVSISETGYVVSRSVDSLQLLNLTTGGGWGFYDTSLVHQLNIHIHTTTFVACPISLFDIEAVQAPTQFENQRDEITRRKRNSFYRGGSNLVIHCRNCFEATLLD